jgi:hypothetical protein
MVNQTLVLRINPPRRMVKIATFAKPENVIGKPLDGLSLDENSVIQSLFFL